MLQNYYLFFLPGLYCFVCVVSILLCEALWAACLYKRCYINKKNGSDTRGASQPHNLVSPGKMTARLMYLHLCAFKLIQLLPDGSLNNTQALIYTWFTFTTLIYRITEALFGSVVCVC